MIKYKIKTGDKTLNKLARGISDRYKQDLKGMHCKKCGNGDTLIEFVEYKLTSVRPRVTACCDAFHERIKEKLRASK